MRSRRAHYRRTRRFRPNAWFWLMICVFVFLVTLVIWIAAGRNSRSRTLQNTSDVPNAEEVLFQESGVASAVPEEGAALAEQLELASPDDGAALTNQAEQPWPVDDAAFEDQNEPANAEDATAGTDQADAVLADDNVTLQQQILQERPEKESSQEPAQWNLLLVNKDHPMPQDYPIEFVTLSNGRMVDERIYPDLQAMFDEARSYGMELFVREAFRTEEDQWQIFYEQKEAFLAEGYSDAEAEEMTLDWVALPGTSEHHTGLAVDINPDMEISTTDEVYTWLEENAWRYGFVKRYPADKTDITGISNEPWHYRYVGHEAAQEMQLRGLCLEEYLEELD